MSRPSCFRCFWGFISTQPCLRIHRQCSWSSAGLSRTKLIVGFNGIISRQRRAQCACACTHCRCMHHQTHTRTHDRHLFHKQEWCHCECHTGHWVQISFIYRGVYRHRAVHISWRSHSINGARTIVTTACSPCLTFLIIFYR